MSSKKLAEIGGTNLSRNVSLEGGQLWKSSRQQELRVRHATRTYKGPWIINIDEQTYPQEVQLQSQARPDEPTMTSAKMEDEPNCQPNQKIPITGTIER